MVIVHASRLSPSASTWSLVWITTDEPWVTVVVMRARPATTVSMSERTSMVARSSYASRHSTRVSVSRVVPVFSMRTLRQIPPGLVSGSRQSQCWSTPVRLRLAVRSRGGAQVISAANTWVLVLAMRSVTSNS